MSSPTIKEELYPYIDGSFKEQQERYFKYKSDQEKQKKKY